MGLRVYISVDIEGMEGVVSYNETLRGKGDYELARRRLTKDVNAAIAGAKAEGTTEILVCEGHADMENLLFDELDPSADLISGAMRASLQMQGIETGFDAMVLFGHAGGGQSLGGVLDHTFNSKKIHGLRLNGLTMNTEAVFNAAVAGHYGIPLVAVIGDRAVVNEVHAFLPNCEGVVVKEGFSRFSARSMHPVRARELIEQGVRRALRERNRKQLLTLTEPLTMEIDYIYSASADTAALVPGVKRISPRTVSFTGDAETVFRLHELLLFRTVDEYPFGF
ncbi:MAG: M55 family metallopeptidase [Clostridia bacterium]|nr:M55 family metallopeptidase [Clostridia bacterium]